MPPDHAALQRRFDASARLSLAGCVPAVPASVSPRSCRMPQIVASSHPRLIVPRICGMTVVRISPLTRNDVSRSGSSIPLSHPSTADACSAWMQMACMMWFYSPFPSSAFSV